ncbi:MAG: hypothetical protein Q9216_003770 [Gyalolechia sp. 2 TL-2023]
MRIKCAPAFSSWRHKIGRSGVPNLPPHQQALSSETHHPDDVLPLHPTWSLQDLVSRRPEPSTCREYAISPRRKFFGHPPETPPTVSPKELHHLLRLSALPLPKDLAEQEKMQKDLQSQLHFVRAIQKIHIPEHVEPLQSIRDETEEGMKEQEYTVASLADEFEKEEVVGKRGRISTKKPKDPDRNLEQNPAEQWDPLALAPKTVGRYVAVNTATD